MPGLTIEELYEEYMDKDTSFAYDVYNWFGGMTETEGLLPEDWEAKYGMYLPTFDPVKIDLAERERDIDYKRARNILNLTDKAVDRVYTTEVDTVRTGVEKEVGKGREIAGGIGLRSSTLEQALGDSIAVASSKVGNLGDRLQIQNQENEDTYNIKMVDTALDFDKTVRDEKEDFYRRTMKAVANLAGEGAITGKFEGEPELPEWVVTLQEEGMEYMLSDFEEETGVDWDTYYANMEAYPDIDISVGTEAFYLLASQGHWSEEELAAILEEYYVNSGDLSVGDWEDWEEWDPSFWELVLPVPGDAGDVEWPVG